MFMNIIQLFHQANAVNAIFYGLILLGCVWLVIGGFHVAVKGTKIGDKEGKAVSKKMGVLGIVFFSLCFVAGLSEMQDSVARQPAGQSPASAEIKNFISDPDLIVKLGKKVFTHLR